jgi:hypothetical protein
MKVSLKPVLAHHFRLTFALSAHGGADRIPEGRHERHAFGAARCNAKLARKARQAGAGQ